MAVIATSSTGYRSDIDGLRAFAVLAVLMFHALPGIAPGGFYGVDVFFVISGYLIGGIILRDVDEHRFTFLDFYARRVRRIVPALLAVLVATLAAGWIVLLPREFADLGGHVAAAAAFVSNFLLWMNIDYFDLAIEQKPLMHLWSLGVEEQFYIVWPLLLVATRAWRKAWAVAAAVVLVSFALSVWAAKSHSVAAFYLPAFRFWELALGSLLASTGWSPRKPAYVRECAGVAGLAMIAIGLAVSLPGVTRSVPWALLPTLGTALAIAAGPSARVNRVLLGNGLMRRIGLISYPLYLWHWPLLSFLHFLHGPSSPASPGASADESLPLSWRLGALASTLVLAIVTYFAIEKPLRGGRHAAGKAIALCLVLAGVGGLGLWVRAADGFRDRLPQVLRAMPSDYAAPTRRDRCHLDPIVGHLPFADECISTTRPNVLLWGDSISAALYPGFEHYAALRGYGVSQLSACPPILGFDDGAWKQCPDMTAAAFDLIRRHKPDVVVMVANWQASGFDGLPETIARLRTEGIKDIVLLGPPPYWRGGFPRLVLSYMVAHDNRLPPARLPYGIAVVDRKLDGRLLEIARQEGARFVSMYDLLCNDEGCLTGSDEAQGDVIVYDQFHFTVQGSLFVARRLIASVIGTQK